MQVTRKKKTLPAGAVGKEKHLLVPKILHRDQAS
jgi:hypothetical protein